MKRSLFVSALLFCSALTAGQAVAQHGPGFGGSGRGDHGRDDRFNPGRGDHGPGRGDNGPGRGDNGPGRGPGWPGHGGPGWPGHGGPGWPGHGGPGRPGHGGPGWPGGPGGPGRPGPGGPGGPIGREVYECVAVGAGQRSLGRDAEMRIAEREALSECRRFSRDPRSCVIDSCYRTR